ncbi:MAG: ABC transporter ATP-binding protein [Thaumarchaeota archaeon]|nr:ABC transporter ATP-binding protein [Nitrososphaerota archaeon]
MPLLDVEDLQTYYNARGGVVKAVDGISFQLNEGESLGIAGESGCGKTTLGLSLMKLLPPNGWVSGGKIRLDGQDIVTMDESKFRKEVRWRKISTIFQGAMSALNPVYTIGYQLAEPLIYHQKMSKKDAESKSIDVLKSVGMDRDVFLRYPHELSGGMKQRVIIAMALILNPKIVIADEPTTALDVIVQAQVINLLKKLKRENRLSIILITHDLGLISEIADKVGIMYAGRMVEFGSIEEVYDSPKHPYTEKLLKSVPRLKGIKRKLEFIPGTPPDLTNPPKGCRFHPRCHKVMEICSRQDPPTIIQNTQKTACWLYADRSQS